MKIRTIIAITLLGLGVVAMLYLIPIMDWLVPRVGMIGMLAIVSCSATLLCAIVAALIIEDTA